MPRLFLLAVLCALKQAMGSAKMPRFKWGQNKNLLFVSVMVRDLDKTSVNIKVPDMETFSYSAKDTSGEEWALDFKFREDVVPGTMHFQHQPRPDDFGDLVLVTVNKTFQHRWDQLTTETKKFKKLIDKDWTKEDPKLEVDEERPYYEDHSDYMRQLTSKNIKSLVKTFAAVVVNVRYPWCKLCKGQDKAFAKTAQKVHKKAKKDKAWRSVTFAVLDAREERSLARSLGAKCDDKCVNKIYGDDLDDLHDLPEEFSSNPDDEEIDMGIKELEKWRQPSVLTRAFDKSGQSIDMSDSVMGHVGSGRFVCSSVFDSETSEEYIKYRKVAQQLRGKIAFTAAFDKKADPPVSVQVTRLGTTKQDQIHHYKGGWDDDGTEFKQWVLPRSVPLIQDSKTTPMDDRIEQFYATFKLPVAKIVYDDHMKNDDFFLVMKNVTRRVAAEFVGKIAFVIQKKTSSMGLPDFGLDYSDEAVATGELRMYPMFAISSTATFEMHTKLYSIEVGDGKKGGTKAFWENRDEAVKTFTDFCNKVLDGSWDEAHQSLPRPKENDPSRGLVTEIVWRTYKKEILNAETDVLLQVFHRQRPDSVNILTQTKDLAEGMKDISDKVKVAVYESSKNWIPPSFGRSNSGKEEQKITDWYVVPKNTGGGRIAIPKYPKSDAPFDEVLKWASKNNPHWGMDVEKVMKVVDDAEAARKGKVKAAKVEAVFQGKLPAGKVEL